MTNQITNFLYYCYSDQSYHCFSISLLFRPITSLLFYIIIIMTNHITTLLYHYYPDQSHHYLSILLLFRPIKSLLFYIIIIQTNQITTFLLYYYSDHNHISTSYKKLQKELNKDLKNLNQWLLANKISMKLKLKSYIFIK